MARAGTITVTTAGTSVQGPDQQVGSAVLIRAHPDNTQEAYVGGANGEVSNTTGFALPPAGNAICLKIHNLNELWFDANVSGEKICWISVD